MVLCRINILGLCTVLCLMTIYSVVCDTECVEYVLVFEETTCNHTTSTPLKMEQIIRNNLTYPCNFMNKDHGKTKCLMELDCKNKQHSCRNHMSFIPGKRMMSSTVTTTKPVVLTTPATPAVTTVKSKTEAVGVHRKMHDVFNPTMYDVNIIYTQSSPERTRQTAKPQDQVLECKYAEIVCVSKEKSDNDSLSNFKNVTGDTRHFELSETLQIEISRDETSAVQPLFTGYFPESSNDSSTNYNSNFQGTMNTSCTILKDSNCTSNIDSLVYINIYFQANYVENNTITKYPNCTKDKITSKNELIVKCEDQSFAKHNPHILQGPSILPPKQEVLTCQIRESKNASSSIEQRIENSKIHFINCANKTETFSEKEIINKNISSHANPANTITFLIKENPNNCSQNSFLNINEANIIDLGFKSIKEKFLENSNVNLILKISNCIKNNSSLINNKQSELIIVLKNDSLNTLNLKHFNGTLKDKSIKPRVLLRCDHTIFVLSSNISSNTTELQCEAIDLDLYHITGIEITPSSQKPKNETKQTLETWNCMILEEQQKNKLYFENCSYSSKYMVNINKNKSEENNVTPKLDINNTNIPREKLDRNKNNSSQLKHMIRIVLTDGVNNCSNNSFLNIVGGKIIDLDVNTIKKDTLKTNNVELKLSDCINVRPSIINETLTDLKDLTIILKSETLNKSDLEQFNGTFIYQNVKQRILLRCEHSDSNYSVKTTSNKTVLQCELIDLGMYNITGIEVITNLTQSSHINNTKEKLKIDEKIYNKINANVNNSLRTNETVGNKEIQNIDKTKTENKETPKKNSENKGNFKNQNFNRKKDIPDGMGQNSLALESDETEKILLVVLLSIVGGAILIVTVLRVCFKKKEYDPAPTREPPVDEETAF